MLKNKICVFLNRSCFCLFVLFISLSSPVISAAEMNERDPREFFFSDSFGDLPDELEDAKSAGKVGMMLFFEMEGCPYCKLMLERVFNQKSVQDYFSQKFVSIAIDIYGDVEILDFDGVTLSSKFFAEHRKVYMTPTMIFFDLKGREIYRRMGSIRTPEAFLLLGEYVSDNHYLMTDFQSFVKSRGL